MKAPSEDCPPEALVSNLRELFDYFLEMGDFSFLADLFTHPATVRTDANLVSRSDESDIPDFFTSPDFLEKVLDGFNSWEKAKHQDIRALIRRVGRPFAEPLLRRLADERNISLRRSYLECVLELGEMASDAAIAGLEDRRWYFVRNLIMILRELGDPSILKHIRRLCDQTHPKVRQEVIRTFQHFNHPEADHFLIEDMNSSNRDLQLNAIQLAEKSRSPEVFRKLLDCLNRGGLAGLDFEIKSAAVRTLAEIRNQEALPTLMGLIRSKNLLRPIALKRLKKEVMNSFANYPADAVWRLFGELSKSDREEMANLVQESLKNTQGRP
jgi:HEAT repeat protein